MLCLSIMVLQLNAQNPIKNAVDSQAYIFRAESVRPLSGNMRILSSGYNVIITKEKIVAYLPYFGRATSAPIDPSDGGIKFTSGAFTYNISPRKKGGWDVKIKPDGVMSVNALYLTVFKNGAATLQVLSNYRNAISFYGYVQPYIIKSE